MRKPSFVRYLGFSTHFLIGFGLAHVRVRVVMGAKFGVTAFSSDHHGNCDIANRAEFQKPALGRVYRAGPLVVGGVFRERGGSSKWPVLHGANLEFVLPPLF